MEKITYTIQFGALGFTGEKSEVYSWALEKICENRENFEKEIPILVGKEPINPRNVRYLLNTESKDCLGRPMENFISKDGLFLLKRNQKKSIENDLNRLLEIAAR